MVTVSYTKLAATCGEDGIALESALTLNVVHNYHEILKTSLYKLDEKGQMAKM